MSTHHLVLLPGLDGTGQLFAPLCQSLPPGFTATIVRYPPDETLTYEQLLPYLQRHNQEEIAQLKPEACCAEIDASHFVLQHKPTEALAAMRAFLAANFGR